MDSIYGQEDPLVKEMATRSSILLGNPMDRGAWRSQRVRHDLVTKPKNKTISVSTLTSDKRTGLLYLHSVSHWLKVTLVGIRWNRNS